MLDMDEISREIDNLEHGQTTYSTIEKLALLYAVRDHARADPVQAVPDAPMYSSASGPPSEFVAAFTSVDLAHALEVMDEHMDSIRVLYPREYDAVLRKLSIK